MCLRIIVMVRRKTTYLIQFFFGGGGIFFFFFPLVPANQVILNSVQSTPCFKIDKIGYTYWFACYTYTSYPESLFTITHFFLLPSFLFSSTTKKKRRVQMLSIILLLHKLRKKKNNPTYHWPNESRVEFIFFFLDGFSPTLR